VERSLLWGTTSTPWEKHLKYGLGLKSLNMENLGFTCREFKGIAWVPPSD
jgi:hypothetical protein